MNTAETAKRERSSGYRLLALAILFSFIWHLFWLSAVKVVAPSPAMASQVKFSKVSFLGQILSKVRIEVRSQRAERSLLERRFIERTGKLSRVAGGGSLKSETGGGVNKDAGSRMSFLIGEAVSGEKAEPEYGSE